MLIRIAIKQFTVSEREHRGLTVDHVPVSNKEVARRLCLRAQQLRDWFKSWHQSTLLDDSAFSSQHAMLVSGYTQMFYRSLR